MRRLGLLPILALAGCSAGSANNRAELLSWGGEIIYISIDLANVAVFSESATRFGPTDLTIANPEWPASPARRFTTDDRVQCVSIGSLETSDEYAVKRPIKFGEQYSCLRTKFRVAQCFDDCSAAIIEMDRPYSGKKPGTYTSYMYVDDCRGALIISEINDFSQGIPLSAKWLRGEVGILAHPDYPKCRSL